MYQINVARCIKSLRVRALERPIAQDSAWHRLVPLVLAPHPARSPEQQHAIALDYCMVLKEERVSTAMMAPRSPRPPRGNTTAATTTSCRWPKARRSIDGGEASVRL